MNRNLASALLLLASTLVATNAVASPPPAEVRVAGAFFKPTRIDGGITWDTRWVLPAETSAEMRDGSPRVVRFAVPLPAGEELDPAPDVAPIIEDGRLAAVRFTREAVYGRAIHVVLRQRLDGDKAHAVRLGAPIANGNALQIIDADLGAETRFELETAGVLERHVGHVSPPGTSRAAREEARRLTGYDEHVSGAAIYVRGEDARAMHGLTATIVTPRARGRHGTIAIGLGFAAVVAALLFAMKKLRHQASVERADAVLAAEVDALDQCR